MIRSAPYLTHHIIIKNFDRLAPLHKIILQDSKTIPAFLDSTKLKIVWIKITTFFKRRVSVIL